MYSLIIVDDEVLTRMSISGYVQRCHPEFHVAGTFSNGRDALAYLQKNTVHLVITDIRMPRMDGLELARLINESFPGIATVIISSYNEFEYARSALRYGVANYLLKPLDFEELSENIHQIKEQLDMMQIEADCLDEDVSLLFSDVMEGVVCDRSTLIQRFQSLSLPISSEDCCGCIVALTLERSTALSQWQYGKEKFSAALLNGLRMLLPDCPCYHLFRAGMRYYFVILSAKQPPTLVPAELTDALYHLLRFTCKLQIQTIFVSLTDLLPEEAASEKLPPASRCSSSGISGAESPNSADYDIMIQKAMSYIQLHYAEDLTREDVASAVYLSSAYFSRLFKQKTGLSFIDYLTMIRMQKAMDLLNSRMKVEEIARQVGYSSRNRFFINFKQYSGGYSPTEYRRQILRMEDWHDNNEP